MCVLSGFETFDYLGYARVTLIDMINLSSCLMKWIQQLYNFSSFFSEWVNRNGRLPKMTPYTFTRLLCLLVFVQWSFFVEGSHFRHALMSFAPTDVDNNTVWSVIELISDFLHVVYKTLMVQVEVQFDELAFICVRIVYFFFSL